jgi:hypothetical protein
LLAEGPVRNPEKGGRRGRRGGNWPARWQSDERLVYESADLIYHLLVLLAVSRPDAGKTSRPSWPAAFKCIRGEGAMTQNPIALPNYEAILFDLDGTLVETHNRWAEQLAQRLQWIKRLRPTADVEALSHALVMSDRDARQLCRLVHRAPWAEREAFRASAIACGAPKGWPLRATRLSRAAWRYSRRCRHAIAWPS